MADHGRSSTARLVAPLALAVVAVAFFAIVLTSGSGGDGGGGEAQTEAARTQTSTTRERTTTTRRPTGNTYTVKVGDTLGGIAEETGVPVETLLELNPELDPQALVSGQKIKLRE